MKFRDHKNLEGLHALFSPSQSHWLRYDDEKVIEVLRNRKAAEMGSRLHQWAKDTIDLGIKQSRSKNTLSAYVNDAIGFKMSTEVVLFYSERFFGTADAISFRYDKSRGRDVLRIHDLKTGKVGKIESHLEQLVVYAALFCLEYHVKPGDIDIELRVYKNDDVVCYEPTVDEVAHVIDRIIHLDKISINYEED